MSAAEGFPAAVLLRASIRARSYLAAPAARRDNLDDNVVGCQADSVVNSTRTKYSHPRENVARTGNDQTTGRATLIDVAREAGVSFKTVSRVINGEPGVAPATTEKVLAAAA